MIEERETDSFEKGSVWAFLYFVVGLLLFNGVGLFVLFVRVWATN